MNVILQVWEKVIFSDKLRFLLHKSDGRVYVRRMSEERFKETYIQTTIKHGGGGDTVWESITAKGVGLLTKVSGRLNGNAYIDLLDRNPYNFNGNAEGVNYRCHECTYRGICIPPPI